MKNKILFLFIGVIGLVLLSLLLSSWLSIFQDSKTFVYLTFDDGPLNGSQHVNDIVLS